MFQVALGNAVRIARQRVDGPQHKEDGRRCNHDRSHDHRVGQMKLPCRRQRFVRDGHQPHRQAGEEHTAENQSLGKVKHGRCPRRRMVTHLILADAAATCNARVSH